MGGSTMQSTLKLALELLRRIPRSRRVTAAELKRELDAAGMVRSLRTIQEMLQVLAEMFDIDRDASRPIGYRWKPQARAFNAAEMTEHESLLLMIARKHLAALLPPSLTQALDGFFEQARRELDPFGDDTLAKQWLSKVHVSNDLPTLMPPKIAEGVLETVSHALYQNLPLTIDYRHGDGTQSCNKARPLGLVQQGVRMYLVCAVEGRAAPYPFSLHRMVKVKAGKLAFERPADFDLRRFDAEGGISFATGRDVKLSFRLRRAAAVHVTESPLSADQVAVDEGDSFTFTATYPDSLRLDRWLWSFGPDLSELRKEPIGERVEGVS